MFFFSYLTVQFLSLLSYVIRSDKQQPIFSSLQVSFFNFLF